MEWATAGGCGCRGLQQVRQLRAELRVFSHLLGMVGGFPSFMLVTRAEPKVYRIVRFDADGKAVSELQVPIFPGCPLPSPWIQGEDGVLYAAEADEKTFRIRRGPALK